MHPNPTLRQHVRSLAENRPGVYRMVAPDGQLLYVGKSVRIRSRLLSYFTAPRGDKAWELVRESGRIEWDYLPNEFAALVREMRQIRSAQPRFNVQHRRKKIYVFVKITRETAPRLVPVSRIAADGGAYFGPFPRVGAVARVVRELAHTLGLRDCPGDTPVFYSDQLELFQRAGPAPRCLRADLRTCLAPCRGRPTFAEYREAVGLAHLFLEGRGAGPLGDIEARMAAAAERLDFEYAALLRDRYDRLRRFQDELAAFRGTAEDLTFVYRVPGHFGDDRIYLIRQRRIHRDLPLPKSRAERVRAAAAVADVYGASDPGGTGLSADQAAEILLVARWFRLRPKELRRTVSPEAWIRDHGPAKAGPARDASGGTRAGRSDPVTDG